MRTVTLFVLSAVLASAQTADALARAQASHKEVMQYLERQASGITARAVDELSSRERWEAVAPKRREEMRRMLGLLPWPERTPLNVKITGTLQGNGYTVEKLAFESLPSMYVTANLYVPAVRKGKVPAIVYVCGHAYTPQGAKVAYQRHGISLAKNGYVAIIIDPIQIAELYGVHHGVYGQEMNDWYSRGYTPAGIEVWNAMRAIDYLVTRPEVDAARIGMTGRSGGAAMTWFTAAVDDRVKAAMPVMGLSTYEANLKENTQKLHCDCMFPINAYLHDMVHQAALIAPRPLLMAHGRKDALFPVPGFTKVEEVTKRLYASYGRGDDFGNIVVETGHEDSDYLREQSIRFFDKHLLSTSDRKLDMAYENAPGPSLAVFPDGAPKEAGNYRIQDEFLKAPSMATYSTTAAWEKRKSDLYQALRTEVFPTFPRDQVKPVVRRAGKQQGFEELEIETEPGVHIRALIRKPEHGKPAPVALYVATDGDDIRGAATVTGGLRDNEAVKMIVYPRGVGEIGWSKSVWREVQRNAMHVGQTVDSMRLRDVMAAVTAVRAESGVDQSRITVIGKGTSAGLALYAAVLDPAIEQVTLIDAPTTHVTGPLFLNVLRHADLPEIAAMVAPRRINFFGRMPEVFRQTGSIYGLYGKPDHLWTTTSIPGPVLRRYDHGYSSGW
jgi:cephalosporin-C deacetylase-like acetyl esterase